MGFIFGLIGNIILGGLVGLGGRAVLPGAQDISIGKTIGLGVIANLVVGLILGSLSLIASLIVGSLVAAGLLWLAIRQGWLKA